MALASLWKLLYGPTADEILAAQRENLRKNCHAVEAELRDTRRKAQDHRTAGNNAAKAGRTDEARAEFSAVAQLNNQCRQLEETVSTLRAAQGEMGQVSSITALTSANEAAARALEACNARMPVDKVRRDAMRLERAKMQMTEKKSAIDNALDRPEEQEHDPSVEDMMAAAMLRHMPAGSTLSSASGTTSALPELRPLPSSL